MAEAFFARQMVRYHPVIGGPHDGRVYRVRTLGRLNDEPVAWLDGKAGCVALEALSAVEPFVLTAIPAIDDVIAERLRQVEQEGYSTAHDDEHTGCDLTKAAGAYALYADSYPNPGEPPPIWPWAPEAWKPKDYRRDLVRAAALLLAEIERMDRKGGGT